MELHQLRYLRAIARHGSFTKAAEQEGVAQPAISKQIKQLEEELGVRLFDRLGRSIALTGAGAVATRYAEQILDRLDALQSEIDDLQGLTSGTIRLCATETIMDYLLPAALATLHRRYPGLHVSAEMLGTDGSVSLLLSHQADVAIITLPLSHPDIEVVQLVTEDVVLLVPNGDALAVRTSVALRERADRELLLSMPGHGLRATVEAACARLGFSPRVALDVRSQEALIRLVERGAGIAFAPLMCVEHAERALHVCRVTEPALKRRIGWARRRGRHTSRAIYELIALLVHDDPGRTEGDPRA